MYPDSWDNEIRPILHKEDIAFLLENTDFDEYDIREWFREFLKVLKIVNLNKNTTFQCFNFQDCPEGNLTKEKVKTLSHL